MSRTLGELVDISCLRLGDKVRFPGVSAFMDGIVESISTDVGEIAAYAVIKRPYMTCDDFSYGNSRVITYIGLESVKIYGEVQLVEFGPIIR